MTEKRLVLVEWDDAVCIGSWTAANAEVEPIRAETVGWLIHEGEKFIQIAATIATDGEYNQSMTIPRGMVINMKELASG